MAKDEISLGVEMERLEIEPLKIQKNVKEENPFLNLSQSHPKRSIFTRTYSPDSKCFCATQKKNISVAIDKKKHKRILKEPVLKLLQRFGQNSYVREDSHQFISKKCSLSSSINLDNLNLCALNQLRISSGANERSSESCNLWKNDISVPNQNKDAVSGKSQAGSCSQQALNPPCDITIDELASYFETMVHIPKKMSSMAEMMYI